MKLSALNYDEIDTSLVTRDLADDARSKDAIERYADRYRRKEAMDPIEVFVVDGTHVLVDGWHRLHAQITAGVKPPIRAKIVGKGSMDDAFEYALQTNAGRGLSLSVSDVRHRIRMLLERRVVKGTDYHFVPASEIARKIGTTTPTATRYLDEWDAEQKAAGREGLPSTVVDKLGREQPRHKEAPKPKAPSATPETCNPPLHVSEPPPKPSKAPRTVVEPEPDAGHPPDDVPEIVEERDPFADVPALAEEPSPEPSTTATPMPSFGPLLLELERDIRSVRLRARHALPEELGALRDRIEGLKAVEHALVAAVPEVCPACEGAGCTRCEGRGWVAAGVAAEMREHAKAREAAA